MYNTFKKIGRKCKKNTRKFRKLKCSPYQSKYVDSELKHYTCYTRNNLQLFKSSLKVPEMKIRNSNSNLKFMKQLQN